VLWDVAHAGQKGTDEREPSDPAGPSRSEPLDVVGAGRMADEKGGFLAYNLVGEAEQHFEDVVCAPQRRGCRRPSHARQVGIDAPKTAVRAKGRFEASLGLAVIDAGAMQDKQGHTLAALHVVHRDVADLAFHSATLAGCAL
jgi:hypothetical protein